MAATQIGKLAVIISGSASELEKVIDGAERRLTKFAAKAASPVTYASKIGGLLSGAAMGPVGIAASAAATVASVFDPLSSHLFDSEKFNQAMEQATERTVTLAREARKLDFTPQFLGALKLAAGPDADAAVSAVKRLERAIGEAVAGGTSELKDGQTNKDKFKRWGLDPEALSKMTSEDAFVAVGKRMSELHDHTAEAAMGFDLLGKSSMESIDGIKRFATDAEKYIDKIKQLGLYDENAVRTAKELAAAKRESDALLAAVDQKAQVRYGAALIEGQIKMGSSGGILTEQWWSGLKQRTAGNLGWLTDFVGLNLSVRPDLQAEAVKNAGRPEQSGISAAEQKLLNQQEDMRVAAEKLSAKNNKEADDMIAHLEAQAATWGKTAEAAKAYELALAGVDPGKIGTITEELRQQERMRLADDTVSPVEKFRKEYERIDELNEGGAFGETARRAMGKAFGALDADGGPYRLASSALRGSAEDAHTQNMQWAEQQKVNRTPEDMAAAALALQEEADKKLERNAKAAEAMATMLRNAPLIRRFPE